METDEDFVQTKASLLKKDAAKMHELLTFQNYKPKEKKTGTKEAVNKLNESKNVINMSKAKHEIMKFSISGLDKTKKEEAKIQLAIKLGAKPPKNKRINYKQLLEQRKLENQRMKTQMDLQQLGKNKVGRSTAKGKSFNKKKKQKDEILNAYGKVKIKVSDK